MGVTRLEKTMERSTMLFCWENQLFRLGHGFFLSQTVDITRPGTLAYGILYWDARILIQRLWLLLTPSK